MALAAPLELAAEEEGEGPARWDLARRARSLGPAACRDGLAAEAEAEAARRTALRPMAAAAAAAVICASGGRAGREGSAVAAAAAAAAAAADACGRSDDALMG
jgi:hypothetical protein